MKRGRVACATEHCIPLAHHEQIAMGKEEQKEEREVLESIFPEEIQDVSDTEFRIKIQLEVTNEDGDDSEARTLEHTL